MRSCAPPTRRSRGKLDEHFPLYVWQTGSGTQSNMNVNEVLSNRAIQLLGGKIGSKSPVHPNDDVNMGQSSNDTFPTAMHIAAVLEIEGAPAAARGGAGDCDRGEGERMGRRGQDRAHASAGRGAADGRAGVVGLRAPDPRRAGPRIRAAESGSVTSWLPGGTAVGTGLNAPPDFSREIAAKIAELTGYPFVTAPNKFAAQGSLDAMVAAMAALRGLAVALMKIANDMRWLASGPRCGLGELALAGERAGLVDHARQGQPDPVRGDGDGLHRR